VVLTGIEYLPRLDGLRAVAVAAVAWSHWERPYLAHGFAGAMVAGVGLSSAAIPEPWRFLVLSGVTLGTAAGSWHLVERPIESYKFKVQSSRVGGTVLKWGKVDDHADELLQSQLPPQEHFPTHFEL
jgi:peptidoglycan/LPS O-acetylase OafA/YrhL